MLRWAVETSRPGDIRANICPKSIQIAVLHQWDSLSWVLSLEFVMNWMIWGSISAKLSQYRVNIWPNPGPASATEHHCLQLAWDGCDKLIEFKHRRPQLAEILDLKIAIWTSSTPFAQSPRSIPLMFRILNLGLSENMEAPKVEASTYSIHHISG